MAKLSTVNRNKKRQRMSKIHSALRKELRARAIDPKVSEDDRLAARMKLQSMPRNGSATRIKVRCSLTGRARGVYRKFGLSRIKFRELALEGKIPGVIKASW